MTGYFDTSALAKYFHDESGSADVIDIIDNIDNAIWISELAIIEFNSAFHRKLRMNELNPETLQTVKEAFENKSVAWNIEPFSSLQTAEANRIIDKYGKSFGIRTLDALHLAAFLVLRQEDWTFVVSDRQLYQVALAAGVNIVFIQ
jgi:predicted nucleic acid-binding protein